VLKKIKDFGNSKGFQMKSLPKLWLLPIMVMPSIPLLVAGIAVKYLSFRSLG